MSGEFSFQTREASLARLRSETFDLLVIGGGITGAAVARDAVSRGLKVALVERRDFAFGTSSRSSKLIHGGLRYLENFEFGLVFEALAERALLLKTIPSLVKPLPFYWPVYAGKFKGLGILSLGLWLYDLLALFRAPGFHRRLSRQQFLKEIPLLNSEGLKGGFRYFDATMWDDVLAVEILRAACGGGAAIASYTEALAPIWKDDLIAGFQVRDLDQAGSSPFEIRAQRTVVCVGPWTDELGAAISGEWRRWLTPSKGVHLVFDLKRIAIPGAMVMNHPEDGRISFVIPRTDYGAGVVIVGTTDGPTPADPEKAVVSADDVQYLLNLLNQYFPTLKLTRSDIVSVYVGVRPLVGHSASGVEQSPKGTAKSLQKVSREHQIERGPGGTTVVAGGKYTTHRSMAEEIVDFTLSQWMLDSKTHSEWVFPAQVGVSRTRDPINAAVTEEATQKCRTEQVEGGSIPEDLLSRYGAEAVAIVKLHQGYSKRGTLADPEGFPYLEAQLRYSIRTQMVVHLEDFYFRRTALFLARKDHGLPWAVGLSQVWAEERGLTSVQAQQELDRLKQEISARDHWT